MELLEVVGGREPAEGVASPSRMMADAPYRCEHGGQRVVRLGRDEPDRGRVDLLDGDGLAADGHHGQRRGNQVLVLVDILVPEDEVIGREGMAVAPFHPATELERGGLAVGADLPGLGDIGHELGARVIPVEELVVLGGAMAIGGVEGAGEAPPPRAAVFPDLAARLDAEGILADPLLDGRKLARLDQLGELRGFLEALRIEGGIGDDLGPLELADEVRAQLGALGGSFVDEAERHLRRWNGEQTEAHQRAPRQAMALRPRDFLVFAHGISFPSLGSIDSSIRERDRSHPRAGPRPCQATDLGAAGAWSTRPTGSPKRSIMTSANGTLRSARALPERTA